MSRRSRNLSLLAAVALALALLGFSLLPRRSGVGPPDPSAQSAAGRVEASSGAVDFARPNGIGNGDPGGEARSHDLRTYAVSSAELEGLPPDPRPGTRLDVWVAWEPPITEEVRFQKLLAEVTIQQVVPGLVPEEPSTVMLALEPSQISDILYADRYGLLSVVTLPAP